MKKGMQEISLPFILMTCRKDNPLDIVSSMTYIMQLILPVSFYLFFIVATRKNQDDTCSLRHVLRDSAAREENLDFENVNPRQSGSQPMVFLLRYFS